MNYQILIEGQGASPQDVAGALPVGDGSLFCLADGAGGTSRGEDAARLVYSSMVKEWGRVSSPPTAGECGSFLMRLDKKIARFGGQTTAIIVSASPSGVCGASVGDSIAWLIEGDTYQDLTAHSPRKPLLGSAEAEPALFGQKATSGVLLIASDGLWRYASAAAICDVTRQRRTLRESAEHLLQSARLPSGNLQDDLSLVLCELGAAVSRP